MWNLEDFVFCADRNYKMPIKVAVSSLLWARRRNLDPIKIHLLDCGLSDGDWVELTEFWHSVSPCALYFRHKISLSEFSDLPGWNGGLTVYARLMLPLLLCDVDWCCYVDGDVLFVDDPKVLGGYCRDDLAFVGHKNPDFCRHIDIAWFEEKGYDCDPEKYICAGFALMNLDWMRQVNFTSRAFAFLRSDSSVPTCDQTVLNYFCMGKTDVLPKNWGAFSVEVGDLDEISCVHYVSRLPWRTPLNWRYYAGDFKVARLWYIFVGQVLKIKGWDKHFSYTKACVRFLICMIAKRLLAIGDELRLLNARFSSINDEMFRKRRNYKCIEDAINRLVQDG